MSDSNTYICSVRGRLFKYYGGDYFDNNPDCDEFHSRDGDDNMENSEDDYTKESPEDKNNASTIKKEPINTNEAAEYKEKTGNLSPMTFEEFIRSLGDDDDDDEMTQEEIEKIKELFE